MKKSLFFIFLLFLWSFSLCLFSYPTGIDFSTQLFPYATLSNTTFSAVGYLVTDSVDYLFYGTQDGKIGYYVSFDNLTSILHQQQFTEGYFPLSNNRKNFETIFKNGYLFLLWSDAGNFLRFRYSRDGGSSWSSSKGVNLMTAETAGLPAYFPHLVDAGNYLYAFWWNWTGQEVTLKYNYTPLYADTFQLEKTLLTAAAVTDVTGSLEWDDAFVFNNNKYIFVYYKSLYNGAPQIFQARLNLDTLPLLSLKDSKIVTLSQKRIYNFKAISKDGFNHLFYLTRTSLSSQATLYYKKTLDLEGETFSVDKVLTSEIDNFEVKLIGGKICVFIQEGTKFYVSESGDNGNSFSQFYPFYEGNNLNIPFSLLSSGKYYNLVTLSDDKTQVMVLKGENDSEAPSLKKVALIDSNYLKVRFSEAIDSLSFSQDNFKINGGYTRIYSSTLSGEDIIFRIDAVKENSNNLLEITNVKDKALNEANNLSSYFLGPSLYTETNVFSQGIQLSSSNYDNSFPFSVTEGDKTYIFYFERLPYAQTGSLKMVVLNSEGEVFLSPISLTNLSVYTFLSPYYRDFLKNGPQIFNGKIYFAYVSEDNTQVILKIFNLDGTKENELVISQGDGYYYLPSLAITSSYIHCLYSVVDSFSQPSSYSLYYRRAGMDLSFGTENKIAQSSSSFLNLPVYSSLFSRNSQIYLGYVLYSDLNQNKKVDEGDTSKLYFLKAINEGEIWRSVKELTQGNTLIIMPKIIWKNNQLELYYLELDSFLNGILYKLVSQDEGENFSYTPYKVVSLFASQLLDLNEFIYQLSYLPQDENGYLTFFDSRGSGNINLYFENPLAESQTIYKLSTDKALSFSSNLGKLSNGAYYLLSSQKNTFDDKLQLYLYYYDKTPPKVEDIEVLNKSQIQVIFSEQLSSTAALDVKNYLFSNLTVKSVTLTAENKAIILTVTPALSENTVYSLNISNVADLYGNVISSGSYSFRTPSDFSNYLATGLSGWMDEWQLSFQNSFSPQVVLNGNYLNLFYLLKNSTSTQIVNQRFSLSDKKWEEARIVNSSFSEITTLKVEGTDSHLMILFKGKESSASSLIWYYQLSQDGGISYNSPVKLEGIEDINISYLGSSYYSLFTQIESDAKTNIYFRKFTSYGEYPQSKVLVNSQSLYNSLFPQLTLKTDKVFASWIDQSGTEDYLYFSKGNLDGNFSVPQNLWTGVKGTTFSPRLVYNADKLVLYFPEGNKINYKVSYTQGESWSDSGAITIDSVSKIEDFQIKYDSITGKYYLILEGNINGHQQILSLNSYNGTDWSMPQIISSDLSSNYYSPDFQIVNGKLYVFYVGEKNGIKEIFYRTTDLWDLQKPFVALYTFPNPARLEEITALIVTEKDLREYPKVTYSLEGKTNEVKLTKIKSDTYLGSFTLPNDLGNNLYLELKATVVSPYNNLLTNEAVSAISLINLKSDHINLKSESFSFKTAVLSSSNGNKGLLIINNESGKKVFSLYPSELSLKVFSFSQKGNYYLARKNPVTRKYIFVTSYFHRGNLKGGNKYYLLKDKTPPQILKMAEERGILRVSIKEEGSGIYKLVLKDRLSEEEWELSPFKIEGNEYYFKLPSLGDSSNLSFYLYDNVGNYTMKSYQRKSDVFSIKSFYVYPNPVSEGDQITIKILTNQSIDKAEIKILDFSGKLVKKFPVGYAELEGNDGDGNYIYKIYWTGVNEEGYQVSNGTYFLKLKVFTPQGEVEDIFKLTILK